MTFNFLFYFKTPLYASRWWQLWLGKNAEKGKSYKFTLWEKTKLDFKLLKVHIELTVSAKQRPKGVRGSRNSDGQKALIVQSWEIVQKHDKWSVGGSHCPDKHYARAKKRVRFVIIYCVGFYFFFHFQGSQIYGKNNNYLENASEREGVNETERAEKERRRRKAKDRGEKE